MRNKENINKSTSKLLWRLTIMKPTIFFSHSSKDKESLIVLKELIEEKTGGTINIFMSSDG